MRRADFELKDEAAFEALMAEQKVAFSGTRMACPATQFYVSAHIKGIVQNIADESEKCRLLEALMRKFQPEGGYEPIDATNTMYTKMISQTSLWRIAPTSISTKAKAGQQLSSERRDLLLQKLAEREGKSDTATAELIKSLAPSN